MSNRGEMWVHGSSVVVQYPGGEGGSPFTPGHRLLNAHDDRGVIVPSSDLLGIRSKYGATFRGSWGTPGNENTNWFHFSIPTPAVVPQLGVPALGITVDVVSVYYKTPNDQITIQAIEVSQGGSTQVVRDIDGSLLHSDHSVVVDPRNHWPINPITMRLGTAHGVLISVKVRFNVEGEITFTAAAIHYSVDPL